MNESKIGLGLKKNWKQFTLLVIVNAFVGAMVGLERTIFPEFAESQFNIQSASAIMSFIITFGLSKAIANYLAGRFSNQFGRKKLLIVGWLFAIPFPFLLIYASSWQIVVFANILLGISQGFTWSTTVVMKIDIVGESHRGLAMGLNEFAGYAAVGLTALLSGVIANHYGVTPYPFYLGVLISFTGLALTYFWVDDTMEFVKIESQSTSESHSNNIFLETSFTNRTLSSVTQAGLVNNLNDGMIWGLLPVLLSSFNLNVQSIAIIVSIYPLVWGIGQLFTGRLSDIYSKKNMLFIGMLLQGIAISTIPFITNLHLLSVLSGALGLGTAMVYPTFLSTLASATKPKQRAETIGVFRLWRDLGYPIGAILSGLITDYLGIQEAILFVATLTILSAIVIKLRIPDSIDR